MTVEYIQSYIMYPFPQSYQYIRACVYIYIYVCVCVTSVLCSRGACSGSLILWYQCQSLNLRNRLRSLEGRSTNHPTAWPNKRIPVNVLFVSLSDERWHMHHFVLGSSGIRWILSHLAQINKTPYNWGRRVSVPVPPIYAGIGRILWVPIVGLIAHYYINHSVYVLYAIHLSWPWDY